ncbi:hypothetical protein PHYSODRAFT_303862 [Phytophthora sojae]|uniref:Uncharacterized protein n=1 Tax=Phytophthora sojae (strain P6497) TaxID=1094619 RepID=G4ZYN8_PHYSP|nr:hypothetical protein PHYSODRAFT_303862 [Phytophthora sojae]EGZ12071.1 hypothetical protein PHYSODRAFT_303862 [Phytophthora sojae]|eukprot:XP_009532404.1 hypothetical protein PHYSODRAFT_303862 [Phytophthora sojae]
MAEILPCALLLLNLFNISGQLSTWRMHYGFALGVQLGACYSLLLLVLLLRGIWGPIALPFLRLAVAQVMYIVSASAIAGLAALRLVYCIYMRELLLNHWPRDDLRTVRSDYYFMESITWTLQAAFVVWTLLDLLKIRGLAQQHYC